MLDKIFVSLSTSEPDATEMGFAIDKQERLELIAAEPEVFFLKDGHDDKFNFARVRLSLITGDELAEVITDAWRRIAPVRLRQQFDESD